MQNSTTHKITYLNCPEPLAVNANDNYCLNVTFDDGVTKRFDFLPYFKYSYFEPLKDIKLFKKAYVVPSAIVWNEDLDIAIEEVYEEGETITNNSKITANRKAKK